MTTSEQTSLVDAATATVLGVGAYRERLDPDSDAGGRLAGNLQTYRRDDREAWLAEIERLETLERWVDDSPDRHAEVRRSLERLPSIAAEVRRLDEGPETRPLREPELFAVKQFLYFGSRILRAAEELVAELGRPLRWRVRLDALSNEIHPGRDDTPRFHLAGELSPELADLLEQKSDIQEELTVIRERVEEKIVSRLGGSFDLEGRYLPGGLSESELESSEELERGDDGWRPASAELSRKRGELEAVRERLGEVEREVRAELTEAVAEEAEWLESVTGFLAELDFGLARVRLRRRVEGCWGTWRGADEDAGTMLSQGREPRVERLAARQGHAVQPVDFELSGPPAVVTGPNMGGKSALLALVGLAQWCLQHAMPVPAASFESSPVCAICYVGSEEPGARDASEGLSSFGREVRRIVELRESSEAPSLWLLDEVGRGTHPEDGAELAIDVLENLHRRGHRVLAATHFPAVAAHQAFEAFRIRGIVDTDALEEALAGADTLDEIEVALRSAMDFQPVASDGSVPRDARIVARALGLES